MRPTRTSPSKPLIALGARQMLLAAAVVLLVLVGRDMARTVHAGAGHLAGSAVAVDAAPDERTDTPAPARHDSHRKVACGVGANIARLQGHDAFLAVAPAVTTELPPPTAGEGMAAPAVAPTTPPSVLRALLQVYRI